MEELVWSSEQTNTEKPNKFERLQDYEETREAAPTYPMSGYDEVSRGVFMVVKLGHLSWNEQLLVLYFTTHSMSTLQ